MAGVFISHSSRDKVLISRIAVDLALEGIPVWFDSWEMELGDSLYERIFDGIDQSTFLIVALSESSVQSKWVKKELNAALSKEEKLHQKIILPVRVDSCEIPLSISDRIYADLADGYPKFIDNLVDLFIRKGLARENTSEDVDMLPIRIRRGFHVNDEALGFYLNNNRIGQKDKKITRKNVVISDDQYFYEARNNFYEELQSWDADRDSPIELGDYAENLQRRSRRVEMALSLGIVELVNNASELDKSAAIRWFIKIMRFELLLLLQKIISSDRCIDLGGVEKSPMSNPNDSALFYGDSKHHNFVCFNADNQSHFTFYCSSHYSDFDYLPVGGQVEANLFAGSPVFWQYLIPQMVARHYYFNAERTPLVWDFSGWLVGYN